MKKYQRVFTTIAMVCVSAGGLLVSANALTGEHQEGREIALTGIETEKVLGGMEASISSPANSARPRHDNVLATASITNWWPSGDYVVAFMAANSSGSGSSRKIASDVRSLPQNQARTWSTRTNWPLTTALQDVWLEHEDKSDGNMYPAFGNNLRQNIRPHGDLYVAGVVFHRLNGVTTLPAVYTEALDVKNPTHWGTSADGIFSQRCTTGKLWNFRQVQVRNSTVTNTFANPCVTSADWNNSTCVNAFDALANNQPHLYHVFLVQSIASGAAGFALYRNWTAIVDNFAAGESADVRRARFAALFDHEFGHNMGLEHVDKPCSVSANCGGDLSVCRNGICEHPNTTTQANLYTPARNTCTAAGTLANTNLMCTSFLGRGMVSNQCSHMAGLSDNRPHKNCLTRSCP